MLRLFLVSCILISFASAIEKEICYPKADLGCFTTLKPFGGTFQRPLALLPAKPESIATRFRLFNRQHPEGYIITAANISDKFIQNLKTKMITHGFTHNDNKEWVLDMRKALLKAEDLNVITVDWSKGNGLPYTQATANAQVVGREIAKLINSLCEKTSAVAEDFHLIGHSLGAHASGYAGERLKAYYKRNLGRISGLDPAGPYFENTDPSVRLDPTDANFVDAIHSDGASTFQGGLGLFQSVGHVDFFVNGGKDQPDCPQTSGKLLNAFFSLATLDPASVEDGVACSHSASFQYFTDSIANKCKYTAYQCDTEADFDAGLCIECGQDGCNRMGYWASMEKDTGRLFLNTQSPNEMPYCLQNYGITLLSNDLDGVLQTRGTFKFYFITNNHQSTVHTLDAEEVTFKKNSIEQKLVSIRHPIDEEITDLFVSFTKTGSLVSGWLYWDKWSFRYIEVFSGDKQKSERFCPYTPFIQSGATVRFSRCE